MKVWIDVLTPKQVLFFRRVTEILRSGGHDVLVTSRRFREVEQLASIVGLELRYAGAREGGGLPEQLKASIDRMNALLPIVTDFRPQVAASVASYDCARIAFGLAVRHVAVNDSPHSAVAGRLSIPLSYHLMTPWVIPYGAWVTFGKSRAEITRYRALDPAAWLKGRPNSSRSDDVPDKKEMNLLVRVEDMAPYMAGSDKDWTSKVIDRLLELSDLKITVLCRYDEQIVSVRGRYGDRVTVPDRAVDGAALIEASDAFVGMGGTMTAEAALMGVPTISLFQGPDLYTERYLLAKKLLQRPRTLRELGAMVENALKMRNRRSVASRAKRILDSMEDPAVVVARFLVRR